jgi:hypothetical protein
MLDALIEVSKNCIERSGRADHAAAQLRLFCYGEVSDRADRAVEALRTYGTSILMYVYVVTSGDKDEDAVQQRTEIMTNAADAYRAALAAFESTGRDP